MLPVHALCARWPDLEGREFDRMVESIKNRGLRRKIRVYGGMVIDGKNRQRACVAAGLSPEYVEWIPPEGCTDKKEIEKELAIYIDDENGKRRHLSATERAFLAVDRIKEDGFSIPEAAQEMEVSPRMVDMAKRITDRGSDEVVKAARQGQIYAPDAVIVSDLPKVTQSAALRAVREGKAKTLAEATGRKKKPKALPPVFNDGPDLEALKASGAVFPEASPPEPEEKEPETTDGFPLTSQSSWRSSFGVMTKMNDQWLSMPKQRSMRMKSERVHAEFKALLYALHKKWVEMNPGARWS